MREAGLEPLEPLRTADLAADRPDAENFEVISRTLKRYLMAWRSQHPEDFDALMVATDRHAYEAAAVDTLATTAAQPGVFASQSFDVSGSDFDSLSSVTFRIYINDNGGFSNSAGANLDNLVVTGEVVPEPASLMLAAGGVLLIGLRRRSA